MFRQSIAKGSYIFSLGDESTDYCLPNLTFDLRKNNEKVDLEQLYSRLEELFEKIKYIAGFKENQSINDVIVDNNNEEILSTATDEDEDEDEEEEEEDELEFAVRQFFIMFAFVSQFCDKSNDRPVHVYIEEENGGDVDLDLAKMIQHLFPRSKLIAICEEDLESIHDSESRIISWTGLASVITRDGIFNVHSDGQGNFELASKLAFLSWSKFFEDVKSSLIVRYSVPDIWLGTQDNYYIKGSYIDYSNNIESFIYFEEFFHSDLNERFEILREIIENA